MGWFQKIACVFVVVASCSLFSAESPEEAERTALAVDALSRLQGVDLEQNAKLKSTVLKVLEKTRGTPSFLKLVQHFNVKGQESGLLEVAQKNPASEEAVEAMRLLLSGNDDSVIRHALQSTNVDGAI
ncbi:MAG TPA: hypothetical protein VMZ27_14515, partial [Candidatus Saccharimonadales bacterium]|nr:hypothetical protein [Candidatus Saccharimonadales bacterium]